MSADESLVILRIGDEELFRANLSSGSYDIGRDNEVQIFVDSQHLSRRHARLLIEPDRILLEDLGSSNGTSIDGRDIDGPEPILPGQDVRLGEVIFEIHRPAGTNQSEARQPEESDDTLVHLRLPGELLTRDRYGIGEIVAKGGMGAVINARQYSMRRDVAMKVMLDPNDDHGLPRFINEAQITGQLEHPNIVPVHELGVDANERVFYTMKLVQGVTLRKILSNLSTEDDTTPQDRLTSRDNSLPGLLTIFQKVCDAIAFAHSRSVIHRDLKPANIMVGDFGEVLVMDWGLAKVTSGPSSAVADTPSPRPDPAGIPEAGQSVNTIAGSVLGTPRYMSPEQARGEIESLDARADIYSLGTILFEILHLRPVFPDLNKMVALDKVATGEIDWERPGETHHLPGNRVPESLLAVCRKSLAFNPDQRYGRVEDLQADLAAYQAGFATAAESASAWKQFTLFLKRNKNVSTAVAASLVLVATLSIFYVSRIIQARNHAEDLSSQLAEKEEATRGALDELKAQIARADTAVAAAQTQEDLTAAERDRADLSDAERARLDDLRKQSVDILANYPELTAALKRLEELQAVGPELARIAEELMRAGNPDAAARSYAQALAAQPQNTDYRLKRAVALQGSYRLTEAVAEYKKVLAKNQNNNLARINLELAQKILELNGGTDKLSEDLKKLLEEEMAKQEEIRTLLTINEPEEGPPNPNPTAEPTAPKPASPEFTAAELALYDKLTDYTSQPGWDNNRISENGAGELSLSLEKLQVGDLSALRGTNLHYLNLSRTNLSNLDQLTTLPLHTLNIYGTDVTDLSPLQRISTLKVLDVSRRPSGDLSGLRGMALEQLKAVGRATTDLTPLKDMPLRSLELYDTGATDLSPLIGMPLALLDIRSSLIDSLAPLAGMPLNTLLTLNANSITDFTPLETLVELETLSLPKQAAGLSFLANLPNLRKVVHARISPNEIHAATFLKLSNASDRDYAKYAPILTASGLEGITPELFTYKQLDEGLTLDLTKIGLEDLTLLKDILIYRLHLGSSDKPLDLADLGQNPLRHLNIEKAHVTSIAPALKFPFLLSITLNHFCNDIHLLPTHPTLKFIAYDFDERLDRARLPIKQFFAPRTRDAVQIDPTGRLILQSFDDLNESSLGWAGTNEDGEEEAVVWSTDPVLTKGRGGGQITFTERTGDNKVGYFRAPEIFLGDKSVLYGGSLEFQLRQYYSRELLKDDFPDVILRCSNGTLAHRFEAPPLKSWRTYLVPLRESEWKWEIPDKENDAPEKNDPTLVSAKDMREALGEIVEILIRAEFTTNGEERTDLDELTFWNPEATSERLRLRDEHRAAFDASVAWRHHSTFTSQPNLYVNDRDVFYLDGTSWIEEFEGHKGLALLHPVETDEPSVITYTLPKDTPSGSHVEVVARGSENEPGVRIKILLDDRILLEQRVDKNWETLRAPIPKPLQAGEEITIEIWPVGWSSEYFYIDTVEIKEA